MATGQAKSKELPGFLNVTKKPPGHILWAGLGTCHQASSLYLWPTTY